MKHLTKGRLLRRYKRFLADVDLDSGGSITVHCPNTGSMKNCVEENAEVWLSHSDNPKRKYAYTWEYIKTRAGHYICVNTGRANSLVSDAISRQKIPELINYDSQRREVRYGNENSRIDILLTEHENLADCFVEVKSVTLLEEPTSTGVGYFPDSVTERGAKHLRELALMKQQGYRSVLLFCVQHTGIKEVRPADHIDSRYGATLRQAASAGVEVLAYKVRKNQTGFSLWRSLPVVIE